MYLLQFFVYEHLPPHLQLVSKSFSEMAKLIVEAERLAEIMPALNGLTSTLHQTLPDNPEKRQALFKLMQVPPRFNQLVEGKKNKGRALRMLLEAKDCGVRAVLFKGEFDAGEE